MAQPLISVIVLNYRSPFDCIKCIEALLKQTLINRMEIIVVDNHSEDESIGWLQSRFKSNPHIKIIESPTNCGFSAGNNYGARYATGEYLLILNPDNVFSPDGVRQMIDVMESDSTIGILGPALVHPDGSVRPSARKFPTIGELIFKRLWPTKWNEKYLYSRSSDFEVAATKEKDVDWLVGACLLMKRDFFLSLGGFDERFFLFFEDIDLCRRCKKAGKRVVYAPAIHVADRRYRLSGRSVGSLLTKKTTWIHLASAGKYFWKWHSEAGLQGNQGNQ